MKIYPVKTNDEELVAVIMAAVAAYYGPNFRIKTITRVDSDSAWAKAGKGPAMHNRQYFAWR